MTITINGVEFTEITTNNGPGILIHDLNDINHDGDCITSNAFTLPETEEDAQIMLDGEPWTSCFHIENGVYYFD